MVNLTQSSTNWENLHHPLTFFNQTEVPAGSVKQKNLFWRKETTFLIHPKRIKTPFAPPINFQKISQIFITSLSYQ